MNAQQFHDNPFEANVIAMPQTRKPEQRNRPRPTAADIARIVAALAARIRARRETLKMSQAAAAEAAGWAPSTWADIERGRFTPKLDTLIRVAAALGWTLSGLCRI